MKIALKQIERLEREVLKIKDNLKKRLEEQAQAKKAAPKVKTIKEKLPPKLAAVMKALSSDEMLLEQVRALVRIHKRTKKAA